MAGENASLLEGYNVNPDTGDVTGSPGAPVASADSGLANNVFATLKGSWSTLVGAGINAYRDITVARTRATPGGSAPVVVNPGFGTASAYPQNDPKSISANSPIGGFAISLPILALIILGVILLLRR